MSRPERTDEHLALEVDWERAGRWAGRLASPGPVGTREELVRVVTDLRAAAERARGLAMRAGAMAGAVEAAGNADLVPELLVVDRAGWARGAAASFAALSGPLGAPASRASGVGGASSGVRAAPATAQAAGLLGVMSARVLGQFDPFGGDAPGGRLMLVAPNVLRAERAVSADPAEFRLWVCVHEQAHALQFAAAPWLADHLRREVGDLVGDMARSSAAHEMAAAVSRGLRALRSGADDDLGLLEVMLEPEHRERVQRITAVMSLLEGHADVTMDRVGRKEIPSARRLRARFDARRRTATGLDRILRRLIGLDAKLEQYRRGAAFVRAVRRAAGPDGLDPAWRSPDALPTPRELVDARAWVRRVHG